MNQKYPRRSGAPLPLLVPCFLARTRPLLRPRRSMRHSTSEPAASWVTHGRLYRRAAPSENSQRHRPSYTVSPAGQRLKCSPAVGAAQAVGRHKKAPPGSEDFSGAKVLEQQPNRIWPVVGPPTKLVPSDQSCKPIPHKKGPSAKPGRALWGRAWREGTAVSRLKKSPAGAGPWGC